MKSDEMMDIDIDNATSYKTEENLEKALMRLFGANLRGPYPVRYMVVRNRAGRYTAIFVLRSDEMYKALSIARAGFKVFG